MENAINIIALGKKKEKEKKERDQNTIINTAVSY